MIKRPIKNNNGEPAEITSVVPTPPVSPFEILFHATVLEIKTWESGNISLYLEAVNDNESVKTTKWFNTREITAEDIKDLEKEKVYCFYADLFRYYKEPIKAWVDGIVIVGFDPI